MVEDAQVGRSIRRKRAVRVVEVDELTPVREAVLALRDGAHVQTLPYGLTTKHKQT
jgi:hypothetical protein